MGLKQILIDTKAKIENEMNAAINTAIATAMSTDIQPKLVELDTSKTNAINEKTSIVNEQINALKTKLAEDITELNESCERAKQAYKAQKVEEVSNTTRVNYTIQLSKIEEQIASLGEDL